MLLKNLLCRKLRTFFALSGVALGIVTLVALNSVTQGMLRQLDRIASDYRGDVMVQSKNAFDPLFSQIDFSSVEKLKTLPEVETATPVVHYLTRILDSTEPLPVPEGHRPKTRFFLIYAMPADSKLLQRHHLARGRYFTPGAREVIIGDESINDLHIDLDGYFNFSSATFKVVGVYHTGIRLLDRAAIYSLDQFSTLHNNPKVNVVALDLKHGHEDIQPVMERINRDFNDLEPIESGKALDQFRQAAIVRAFAFGIALIAVCIAGLGILNTMMMSVHERTREIGILRALGWPKSMVIKMIIGEGLLLSAAGGVLGSIVGVLGTEILIRTVDIGVVNAEYSASLWLQVAGLSLAVGALGSVLPAWKATRIAPIEALRHE